VSTGVERYPARRTRWKVKAFIERARQAAPVQYVGPDEMPYDWAMRIARRTADAKIVDDRALCEAAFGEFGGRFVPKHWCPRARSWKPRSPSLVGSFVRRELNQLLREYAGRRASSSNATTRQQSAAPTAQTRGTEPHGSHKINNVLGQALLAKRMGKTGSSPRPAPASTESPARRRRR